MFYIKMIYSRLHFNIIFEVNFVIDDTKFVNVKILFEPITLFWGDFLLKLS